MSKLSRILRWAALPLALSMTATLAQATILYAGNPTSLGTLSETAPTLFEDSFLPLGVTFNDYWKFTLPTRINGRCRWRRRRQLLFFAELRFSSTPIDLSVSIGGVTVTGPSDHFSFTGTPGTPYTLDISGTTGASAHWCELLRFHSGGSGTRHVGIDARGDRGWCRSRSPTSVVS
jgi:hypothetical protein